MDSQLQTLQWILVKKKKQQQHKNHSINIQIWSIIGIMIF